MQPLGLRVGQHAERHAGFHAETLHGRNHLADFVEILVLGIAPCRSHTEACRTRILRALRGGNHIVFLHQFGGIEPGVVMRALRAVAAILRTAAGLDAQQARGLDVIGIEIAAVNALRLKNQIGERQIVKRLCFSARPVASQRIRGYG